jgi:RNA polymerase sigma-70 factor, ECF subfamily
LQPDLRLVSNEYEPDPEDLDDHCLVEGLRRGDPRITEYVVHRFAPALYRFTYYQVQDAMLAEDIVSEVMARMIENVERFVLRQAPFRAWLFRIARNLIADHYRTHKRCSSTSLEEWLDTNPDREPGCSDVLMEIVIDRDRLRRGLLLLTCEQREVILLHLVEGWELPEIARLLDRSLASVKGLYYRGIESLRRALEQNQARE